MVSFGEWMNANAGLLFLGVLVVIVIITSVLKGLKAKRPKIKMQAESSYMPPKTLPDISLLKESMELRHSNSIADVTTDAIKLLQTKRNLIQADIIKNKQSMLEELKNVKKTQTEIYSMLELLIGYYKDLQRKEVILQTSVSGLIDYEK